MGSQKPTILAVDDEAFNLEILTAHLEETEYDVVTAEDGVKAWSLIEKDPLRFDAILLDRMMPNMDGIEVLSRIKAHPDLKMLPVILQTAQADKQDMLEALHAGSHYYLIKPFDKATMLAIVKTAVADYQNYRSLQIDVEKAAHMHLLNFNGHFAFRTLEDARNLAMLLSNVSPMAGKVVVGLLELLINAVEHGNLGITYEEKSELNALGRWQNEVERRLGLPENADKVVEVKFQCTADEISFLIQDQGEGFDWESYLEITPERVFDNHGRGIAMSRMLSFDCLEYQGNGSQVLATLSLKEDA